MDIENFYHSCSVNQKQALAQLLQEDMFIRTNHLKSQNLLDEIFIDNLNILVNKRHLLTKEQEDYINSLATRYKY
jgi:hypothetical protein